MLRLYFWSIFHLHWLSDGWRGSDIIIPLFLNIPIPMFLILFASIICTSLIDGEPEVTRVLLIVWLLLQYLDDWARGGSSMRKLSIKQISLLCLLHLSNIKWEMKNTKLLLSMIFIAFNWKNFYALQLHVVSKKIWSCVKVVEINL